MAGNGLARFCVVEQGRVRLGKVRSGESRQGAVW
jgi:hypothetical protein